MTREISVEAEAFFLDDRSDPEEHVFLWAYRIRISNGSPRRVKLISRHWRITDGAGRLHEVRGTGVIGEQPVLEPGEHYSYVSGTPLPTPSGTMCGTYCMSDDAGIEFEVTIPAFALESPYERHPVH